MNYLFEAEYFFEQNINEHEFKPNQTEGKMLTSRFDLFTSCVNFVGADEVGLPVDAVKRALDSAAGILSLGKVLVTGEVAVQESQVVPWR